MGAAKPIFNAIAKYAGREAQHFDDPVIKKIGSWLMGEIAEKPVAQNLYRGVPTGSSSVVSEGKEYTHATPWAREAARGGKGAFGSPGGHDVYSFPVSKDTKFYRGGSLEGDPLESTRLDTSKGTTWDAGLDKAKEIYQTEVIRRRADAIKRYKDDPEWLDIELKQIPKHTADEVAVDFQRGTFETDLGGKPGIWEKSHVPFELRRTMPKLRSYDDLEDALIKARKTGYELEDVKNFPEAKILRRGQPERYKDLLDILRSVNY